MLLSKTEYNDLCKNEPINSDDVFVYLLDENKEKMDTIQRYCSDNSLKYFKSNNSVES